MLFWLTLVSIPILLAVSLRHWVRVVSKKNLDASELPGLVHPSSDLCSMYRYASWILVNVTRNLN